MYFVVIYSRGPNWANSKAARERIAAHIEYQRARFEAHKLVMGGPFVNEVGGMAIFDLDTEDELAEILNADPAVASNVYSATAHRWRVAVRREDAPRLRGD